MSDKLDAEGLKVRKEVLGADYVEASLAKADDFMQTFQELTTNQCWGYCWTRPGLERRERSLLNLGMLAAMGKEAELKIHVRGAIANGLTADEIKEVFVQVSVYAGVPAAFSAFRIAHETLKEMGEI
ncbi:MAG: carboxymuconolactone decarboxylase family protein [Hyphomicrobiales bacterium]